MGLATHEAGDDSMPTAPVAGAPDQLKPLGLLLGETPRRTREHVRLSGHVGYVLAVFLARARLSLTLLPVQLASSLTAEVLRVICSTICHCQVTMGVPKKMPTRASGM